MTFSPMRRFRFVVPCVALIAVTAAQARNAADLQLDLRRLTVVGGALYIGAHPDDENTAMLAWLANERLLRTASLSVTRGESGQNLIGQETGPLLGVLRTQELLAARGVDRAEQMFTRAIDFGYAKDRRKALEIWGHDAVLADVVWAIRKFQPDVIITRFPETGEGGDGQQTASAVLAEEAFAAAGDASRFPEQLPFVSPWQPKRIFWNRLSPPPLDANGKSIAIDPGTYNPLLGRAYTELAAESRGRQKSQGFGPAPRRGTIIDYFDQLGGDPAQKDLLEGIDTLWARYPGGETIGVLLKKAADSFDPDHPSASVPLLIEALNTLDKIAGKDPEWSETRRPWMASRRQELLDAIRDCAGLSIEVAAAASTVTPGGELPIKVTVVNRSSYPFRLSTVASRYGNSSETPGRILKNNEPVTIDITLKLPVSSAGSQPYWLAYPPANGLYAVTHQLQIGRPKSWPELPLDITLDDLRANTLTYTVPAVFRWTDPVLADQVRDVDIVPPVTVKLGSTLYLYPDAAPRPVTVWMQAFGPAAGKVSLLVPKGWKSEPESSPFHFAEKDQEARTAFIVTPPAAAATGAIIAMATLDDGRQFSQGIVEIAHPHIPYQRVLGDASAKVVRADIVRRGDRIGYILGSGDDIPMVLQQVGYEVTLLSDDELDRGDFSKYDAVVTGVRAYNTRQHLRSAHEKLMMYIEKGGTVVVQYNTADDLLVPTPGPYPFRISRDRVAVAEAPVKLLVPDHPLLQSPNSITAADFDGWVQERGLYFPGEWDRNYTTILATNDPGEPEKPGGQLVARYGKGVFVYTAYSWWRQLPAGVPGAIRAFVNLVSAR
jgi:LmbE family N-acetylglucosaminyl deacetylase